MTDIKWKLSGRASNPINIMTTELNSLTSTGSALSAAIANSSDLDLYVDLELLITYGTAPTNDSAIEVYIVASVDDGSNYEDGSTTGPVVPKNGLVGSFRLRNVTTAQRIIMRGVIVPPGNHKYMIVSKTTGQTAAASGNTLRGNFYKEQAA